MFDVFYFTKPTGLFPHEKQVNNIEHAQKICKTRYFWIVNYLIDYNNFDFLWIPEKSQSNQKHVWRSLHQKDSGTWLVPSTGFSDINYHDNSALSCHEDLDLWTIPAGLDLKDFDFTWHPDYSESPYIYQFGTQWQKTGGPKYHVPGAQEIKFVEQILARSDISAKTAYMIDHFNVENDQVFRYLQTKFSDVKRIRYVDNYFDILKRIAKQCQGSCDFVWICSSICNYENFDFSWHPELWQSNMLQVFASGQQKFGDTFFMNVDSFLPRSQFVDSLGNSNCNFLTNFNISRYDIPVISHNEDSHVLPAVTTEFAGPLAVFTNSDLSYKIPDIALWDLQTKTVTPLSTGGSICVIPKTAIPYIKTQLYDYPYIDTAARKSQDRPLDVIYISNGEPNAEQNFQWLKSCLDGKSNQLKRIDKVKGRVAAYHAALEISDTPWAFCVFAKLKVNLNFDWNWQPDRLRLPKHYIFHARNPVNGLEYGHQALIAYNKKLALNNAGRGLDFTLDQNHDIIPCLSGEADFVHDAWTVWRTAFRETIKLRYINDTESLDRLEKWLSVDLIKSEISKFANTGAADALVYYKSVNAEFSKLKLSYEWHWLAQYAIEIGRFSLNEVYV